MIISNEFQDFYDAFCEEKVQQELKNFKSLINKISMLKKANDEKGCKVGKLYYDVLKAFDLKDLSGKGCLATDNRHGLAYDIVLGKVKKEIALEVLETNLRVNTAMKFSPENIQSDLVAKFVETFEGEVSKENLRTFWKAETTFNKKLIESDVKSFLELATELLESYIQVA